MRLRAAATLLLLVACAPAQERPVLHEEYKALTQVDQETKGFVLLSLEADKAEVAPLRNKIQAALEEVKKTFAANGFAPLPDPLYVMILRPDRLPDAGQADRPCYLALRKDYALNDAAMSGVLAHECFHHVQDNSLLGIDVDPRTMTYKYWADEATAEWIQYKLFPRAEVPLQRAARLTMESFRGPFFTRINVQHAYFSYVFFAYLDPTYDAMSLLRRFYVNPEKDKPGRKLFADPMELLDRAVVTPARPGSVPKRLPEVFVEFLIQARWKKECEPWRTIFADSSLGAECATQIGKPGALKLDTENSVSWNIPWDEGEARLLKKEFDRVSGQSYGIVKEYSLSSMTKKDEVGDLHVSVRRAAGGNARIVVFPFDDSGVREARVGAPGAPVVVRDWHTLGGAMAWIVDVTADGHVDYQLTAEMKAGKWHFKVEDFPQFGVAGIGFRSIQLVPAEPAPKESELAKRLANKWVHATLEIDGKSLHLYGRFTDEAVAWFGTPWARVRHGTYEWRLSTKVEEVAVEAKGVLVVAPEDKARAENAARITEAIQEIRELEQKLAEADSPEAVKWRKEDLSRQHEFLSHWYLFEGRFEEAAKEAEKAIQVLPEKRSDAYVTLAEVCLSKGDVDGFLAWKAKCDVPYTSSAHLSHAAHAVVLFHNDLDRARSLAAQHDAKMKEAGLAGHHWYWPKQGEEILK